MKRYHIKNVTAGAARRKPGYLEAVLKIAKRDGEWLELTDEQMAALAVYHFNKPLRGPCAQLGKSTGATVECPTCNGKVHLKLFACAVHGQCTTGKRVAGVACCDARCGEYATAHKEGL